MAAIVIAGVSSIYKGKSDIFFDVSINFSNSCSVTLPLLISLDLILDCTTWLYDDENPEETPYYLALQKEPELKPHIRFFYWRNQREYKELFYAFLRISFILPKKQRSTPKELRERPLARQIINEYHRQKVSAPVRTPNSIFERYKLLDDMGHQK